MLTKYLVVEEKFYNAVGYRTILAKHDAPSGLRTAVLSRIAPLPKAHDKKKKQKRCEGLYYIKGEVDEI